MTDFIQAIGWVLSVDHLATNSILPGVACNAQGFFINTGDVGSALWSFVIAVHTFLLLAGKPNWRTWAAEKSMAGKGRWFLCLGIWGAVVFLGIIGPTAVYHIYPQNGPFCASSLNVLI
jgi:hypothetical protein